jgi:hypothetical protein
MTPEELVNMISVIQGRYEYLHSSVFEGILDKDQLKI